MLILLVLFLDRRPDNALVSGATKNWSSPRQWKDCMEKDFKQKRKRYKELVRDKPGEITDNTKATLL